MSLFSKDIELNIPDYTNKIRIISYIYNNLRIEDFLKSAINNPENNYSVYYKKIYNDLSYFLNINHKYPNNTMEVGFFIFKKYICQKPSPELDAIYKKTILKSLIFEIKKDPILFEKFNILLGLYKSNMNDDFYKELEDEIFYKIYTIILDYIKAIFDINSDSDLSDIIGYNVQKENITIKNSETLSQINIFFTLKECNTISVQNNKIEPETLLQLNINMVELSYEFI